MKQIFVMFALLLGVCAANAQETDTVKYAAGNDLYRGKMCIRDRWWRTSTAGWQR